MKRLWPLALLAGAGCQWVRFDENGRYRCEDGGVCSKGFICVANVCEAVDGGEAADGGGPDAGPDGGCVPAPCDQVTCGVVSDGCGGSQQCGCAGIEVCGGGGTPNRCARNTRFCSPDGWCWENPWPQGNTLRAVWANAPDDVWAVGSAGTLMHWNGTNWALAPSPSTQTLLDVWGSGAGSVWAVGENGSVLRFDGGSWALEDSGVNVHLNAVWGFSADDVWTVGNSGSLLRRVDGGWALQPSVSTSDDLHDLWGRSADDLYAVGGSVFSGVILHKSGNTWSTEDGGFPLYAAWGTDAGVYVCGTSGDILRRGPTDSAWSSVGYLGNTCRDLFGTGPGDVWAVGDTGLVSHFDGGTWSPKGNYGAPALFGVGGVASQQWMVGAAGTLWRAQGEIVVPFASGSVENMNGVFAGAPDFVLVPMDKGNVGRRAANGWQFSSFAAPADDLYAAWGVNASFALLVGANGRRHLWDGGEWSTDGYNIGPRHLNGVFGLSPADIWVVGDYGRAYHYDGGTSWASLGVGLTGATLRSVWRAADGGTWTVDSSSSGGIFSFTNGGWNPESSGVDAGLFGVSGAGGALWAVGEWGTILRRGQSQSWTREDAGTAQSLRGVWARSSDDVYAVGDLGTVLHWNGAAWSAQQSGTLNHLRAVGGLADGGVWAVGGTGTILRRP
ncbi:MAG: hypothetical protein ACOZIN_11435 [Myxococcota bacterium]